MNKVLMTANKLTPHDAAANAINTIQYGGCLSCLMPHCIAHPLGLSISPIQQVWVVSLRRSCPVLTIKYGFWRSTVLWSSKRTYLLPLCRLVHGWVIEPNVIPNEFIVSHEPEFHQMIFNEGGSMTCFSFQVLGEYCQVGREPSPAQVIEALQIAFTSSSDVATWNYIISALKKQALHISKPEETLQLMKAALKPDTPREIVQVIVFVNTVESWFPKHLFLEIPWYDLSK